MGAASSVIGNSSSNASDPFNPATSPLINERLKDAAEMLSASAELRAVFVEYVQTGAWIGSFLRFNPNFSAISLENLVSMLTNPKHDFSDKTISSSDGATFRLFSSSTATFTDVESERGCCRHAIELNKVMDVKERFHSIIVATAFPIFLRSQEFKSWFEPRSAKTTFGRFFGKNAMNRRYRLRTQTTERYSGEEDEEKDENISVHCNDDCSTVVVTNVDTNQVEKHHISLQSNREQNQLRMRALLLKTISTMDSFELDLMLAKASIDWLGDILAFVETLPVSITISEVRNNGQNFTIMYVNRTYERITKFSRDAVIGNELDFAMYSSEENDPCRDHMHNALREGKSVNIVSDHRRGGEVLSSFRCLSTLKPIKSMSRSLEYIIAIHYDVSSMAEVSSMEREIQSISDLLNLLPSVLC